MIQSKNIKISCYYLKVDHHLEAPSNVPFDCQANLENNTKKINIPK